MKWFLVAVILLAIGGILQLGLLVYAMYALLGVMAISRYLAHEWIENVEAERESNQLTAEINEKVAVAVTIRNKGRWRIPWLLVEDSLPRDALVQKPPRISVDQRRTAILQIAAGGRKALLYQVKFLMRGYYQLGPLLVEGGDLFGLHRRYRILTEPHFVLVMPQVVPLQGYNLASRRPIGEVRLTHRLFEDPTRISGVRPYQTGDPFNRIHWRATARTGTLHSKTYEPSSIAGASILLEFHRDRYARQGEPYRSDLAVTTAASLANALYQMGQQVGLFTNGRDAADRVRQEGWKHDFATRVAARETVQMDSASDRLRPVTVDTRAGADQLMQILETLARAELTDGLAFPSFVSEVSSRLPRDATIVAILPDVPLETAAVLGGLRRQGFAVTAILVLIPEIDVPDAVGRLLAEGIDVRRVDDKEGIAYVCGEQLVGR